MPLQNGHTALTDSGVTVNKWAKRMSLRYKQRGICLLEAERLKEQVPID